MAEAQKAGPPEYTVRLHGIDYAWVYRNAAGPSSAAAQLCGSGDAVSRACRPGGNDPASRLRPGPYKVTAGDKVVLTLYWQARGPMRRSYRVFTHLVDAAGQTRAQHDGIPDGGSYATDDWAEGEVVADRHELLISPDAPSGDLLLGTGMYFERRRLPAFDAAGQRFADDWIELGRVTVVGE